MTTPQSLGECQHCGRPAFFRSINDKKLRCEYRISRCPAIIERQKAGREKQWAAIGPDAKQKHMKAMSDRGNQSNKRLDPAYKQLLSEAIKQGIADHGGHAGDRNSMFGKTHSETTKQEMSRQRRGVMNPNKGQYIRTPEHRDELSKRMITRLQSGKHTRSRDTDIERAFAATLDELEIAYEKQFLIQYGSTLDGSRFRHCYDFKITGTNILVEIDGDYWHSKPEVIERDRLCEEIAFERGYHVIRIKGSDMPSKMAELKQIAGG